MDLIIVREKKQTLFALDPMEQTQGPLVAQRLHFDNNLKYMCNTDA